MRRVCVLPILAVLACAPDEGSKASEDFPDPDVVQLPEGDGLGNHLRGDYRLDGTVVECAGDCMYEPGYATAPDDGGQTESVCEIGADTSWRASVQHEDGKLEVSIEGAAHEGGVDRDGTFDVVTTDDSGWEEFRRRLRGSIGDDGRLAAAVSEHIIDGDEDDPIDCYRYASVSGMKEL